jgi:hypothetical protein
MMLQVQDDNTLMMIFMAIAIIIPGIVLWFDDSKFHNR